MATFRIRNVEGMRQVCVDIENETVRAARGALSNMSGQIDFTPRLPGLRDAFRSIFTQETRIRPFYSGSGTILLQPSMRGFHNMAWPRATTGSWSRASTGPARGRSSWGCTANRSGPGLWAGDGLLVWKTTLDGQGQAVINAPGPVEEVEVDGAMDVQGRLVLGRTSGLTLQVDPFGQISPQLHLRADAAAAVRGQGPGAGLLDALLERTSLPAHDRRERQRHAVRIDPIAGGGQVALVPEGYM